MLRKVFSEVCLRKGLRGIEVMIEIEMLYYLKRYRTLRKVYNETKS